MYCPNNVRSKSAHYRNQERKYHVIIIIDRWIDLFKSGNKAHKHTHTSTRKKLEL